MTPPDPARRLGRGLDALLARKAAPRDNAPTETSATDATPYADGATTPPATDARESALRMLPVGAIGPNPYQPRTEFRPEDLADLEASLKANGLLQPLTVRPAPSGDGFELIAGERRLRAATRLGWTEVPVIVRETDDRAAMTLALVENLQRVDLDPIDEAEGYQRLIEEYALSQQEVADVVGKERSTIANALRLRGLPVTVRTMVQDKTLTAGHARALLALGNEKAMLDLAREVTANGLSVRDVERRVQAGRPPSTKTARKTAAPAPAPAPANAEARRIQELLRRKLQTSVDLHLTGRDRGELRIAFFSNDDLERLLGVLGISLDEL